jgi:hypothetical protein
VLYLIYAQVGVGSNSKQAEAMSAGQLILFALTAVAAVVAMGAGARTPFCRRRILRGRSLRLHDSQSHA